MPIYNITISRITQKQLDKLPDNIADRLIDAIYSLAENPRPTGYKKLKGRNGCRIRVRDYRIIYEIFDGQLLIAVVSLGHRKDIYNRYHTYLDNQKGAPTGTPFQYAF